MRAAPAATVLLDALKVLRVMNATGSRKLPADAPTGFIKRRWEKLVVSDTGLDRRQYELRALSELKNALRSGDIWVQGSRQFKDFGLLSHLSPLGWGHINLTGDYVWRDTKVGKGKFRPLRPMARSSTRS